MPPGLRPRRGHYVPFVEQAAGLPCLNFIQVRHGISRARHLQPGGLMPKNERIREPLAGLPTLEHLVERTSAGWKLIALEWEREATAAPAEPPLQVIEEIPYGLKVSDDCAGLVESRSNARSSSLRSI